MPPLQARPAPHVSPAQQAMPEVPHAAHWLPTQTAPLAVQVPSQHGSPTAPHAPASVVHAPLVHVPPPALAGHVAPDAVHVEAPPAVALGMQQPPLAHESPAQQSCPVPPHSVHVPVPTPVQA